MVAGMARLTAARAPEITAAGVANAVKDETLDVPRTPTTAAAAKATASQALSLHDRWGPGPCTLKASPAAARTTPQTHAATAAAT
jgi:hypothetical protein